MQAVLNFGKGDKLAVKSFLIEYEQRPADNLGEEARWRVGESTVTLYASGKVTIQGVDCNAVKQLLLDGLGLEDSLVLGIDETGRGELTGPMVIAGVLGRTNALRELRDSKKTAKAEKHREKYGIVTKASLANASFSVNAEYVDLLRRRGMTLNDIEAAAVDAIASFFRDVDEKTKIVVDGSPLAVKTKNVSFVPKADDLDPVVGAASIVAKHTRNESSDVKERETWQKKSKTKN